MPDPRPTHRFLSRVTRLEQWGPSVRPQLARPAIYPLDDELHATVQHLVTSGFSWGQRPTAAMLECLDWKTVGGVAGGPLSAALQISAVRGGSFLEHLEYIASLPQFYASLHRECLAMWHWWVALQQLVDERSPVYDMYEWLYFDRTGGKTDQEPRLSPELRRYIADWAHRLTPEYMLNLQEVLRRAAQLPPGTLHEMHLPTRSPSYGVGLLVYSRTGLPFEAVDNIWQATGAYPVVLDAQALHRTAQLIGDSPEHRLLAEAVGQLFSLAYATTFLLRQDHHVMSVWCERLAH
ncbi:hypothetical protein JNJ66_04350 [Candidatus Saccharibacteria bacterium]|nr:hypothetical protein [Candidatus Saccharibacteria bacterium]